MSLREVLDRCPQAAQILLDAGMSCVACSIASLETLSDGARLHGLSLDTLLDRLNRSCAQTDEAGDNQ